jgi:hypothetical protein
VEIICYHHIFKFNGRVARAVASFRKDIFPDQEERKETIVYDLFIHVSYHVHVPRSTSAHILLVLANASLLTFLQRYLTWSLLDTPS